MEPDEQVFLFLAQLFALTRTMGTLFVQMTSLVYRAGFRMVLPVLLRLVQQQQEPLLPRYTRRPRLMEISE
nr:MAG: hypothetical protein [Wufeng shrew polycipivirus 5]